MTYSKMSEAWLSNVMNKLRISRWRKPEEGKGLLKPKLLRG
jgi:hypothetical protein